MIRLQRVEATDAEIDAALRRVLAGPSFREESHPVLDFFEQLAEWISLDGVGSGLRVLWWIVLAVAAIALVALVVHALRTGWRARRAGVNQDAEGDPLARARALCAEATEARRAGDLRLALRLYVAALALGLGQRGEVEYRDAWTNRELVARGEPGPRALELLLPLVRELEPAEFGRAPVREADLDRLERVCDELLGAGAGPNVASGLAAAAPVQQGGAA